MNNMNIERYVFYQIRPILGITNFYFSGLIKYFMTISLFFLLLGGIFYTDLYILGLGFPFLFYLVFKWDDKLFTVIYNWEFEVDQLNIYEKNRLKYEFKYIDIKKIKSISRRAKNFSYITGLSFEYRNEKYSFEEGFVPVYNPYISNDIIKCLMKKII